MTSILFLVETIQLDLWGKKYIFLYFCVHFLNLHQILNIFKRKMTLIAYVFSKLRSHLRGVRFQKFTKKLRKGFSFLR